MDAQQLSYRLDSLIADLLAQRRRRLQDHGKVMRVVLSGEDPSPRPDDAGLSDGAELARLSPR